MKGDRRRWDLLDWVGMVCLVACIGLIVTVLVFAYRYVHYG